MKNVKMQLNKVLFVLFLIYAGTETVSAEPNPTINLPAVRTAGAHSLERVLKQRRSVREFGDVPLGLQDISQLLWAAQGVTDARGYRTAPSAGALYPLEIRVAAGTVHGLKAGSYRYRPHGHQLEHRADGDRRRQLAQAAFGQSWVGEGAAVLIISAVYERTTRKYGERGVRYVHMEAGHAAQNVFLQATALGIDTVVVGAFDDDSVKRILRMEAEEHPLYLMPLGNK